MSRRQQNQATSRRYIRHPSGMPIRCAVCGDVPPLREKLRNFSEGGLCFHAHVELETGYRVRVSIPVVDREFQAEAVVMWCRDRGTAFDVGVRFVNAEDVYSLRMVEQLCHIEEYRREVAREQGRRLTSEQAAMEWIASYAADFPSMS